MKKLLTSVTSMLSILAILSVSAFAAETMAERATNRDPYHYNPTVVNTAGELSSRYTHSYKNIGFVAEQLDSKLVQDIWVELGESTYLYSVTNPVGSRVICTSNRTGGGYTFLNCSTDKKYQWRAGKCADTNCNVKCSFGCGSTSSSNFTYNG